MARKAEPHVYWVNWVCSFLGTRTSEVADANILDIERIDGIWVMSIHRKHRSRDQRLKTKVSARKLALHGALLDEGFLDYWRSLPAGGGRYSPTCRSTPMASEPAKGNDRVLDLAAQRRQDHRPEQTVLFAPATPRLPICATPGCRMDHPLSKRISSATFSAMRARGAHAGYGKRWFETLKAAVEVIRTRSRAL